MIKNLIIKSYKRKEENGEEENGNRENIFLKAHWTLIFLKGKKYQAASQILQCNNIV